MSNLHVDYLYEKDFDMDAICYKSEGSGSIQLLNPRPLKRFRGVIDLWEISDLCGGATV